MGKVADWIKLALLVLGALGTGIGATLTYIDHFATDVEVQQVTATHDADAKAHPALQERVLLLEAVIPQLQGDAQQTTELWRVVVGFVASDIERNPNLKAAASAYYREAFDLLVRKGTPPDIAFREALRQPYYTRPRGQ